MLMRTSLEVLPIEVLYRELEKADFNSGYYCCETRKRWLAYHATIVQVIKDRHTEAGAPQEVT